MPLSSKIYPGILPLTLIFLTACSPNSNYTFDNANMPPKPYMSCDSCNTSMIPGDNWAMLQSDGQEYGRYYRKDGQIFWKAKVDQKMENVDVGTFAVYTKYVDFAQDKNHVYFFGAILPNIDRATFQILSNAHSKDKNGVYYGVHKIEEADPKTFEVIPKIIYEQTPYSKDRNNIYYEWMKIEGADPKTFEVLDEVGHSKDKSWNYLYNKREKPIQ